MVLPGLSTQSHAELQATVGAMYAKSFVYSLMGSDAGEPLKHILIRKEAERKTGGNWWWGLASNIAKELEDEATSNGGTLPVLFVAVAGSNDAAPGQKACVWNGWQSRDGKRGGRIPDHALVISGYDQGYFSEDPKKKEKRYYALVCQSEAEVARGNVGYLNPAKYPTPSGRTRDPRQRTALLIGNPVLQPHGLTTKVDLKADLVDPWYVRVTEPRVLTPSQVAEVHRYQDGDDWLSLVKRLRD
jgi:hypothetical protein